MTDEDCAFFDAGYREGKRIGFKEGHDTCFEELRPQIRLLEKKLEEAENTIALVDFDVFAMEADFLKLKADHEALKTENKRLAEQIDQFVVLCK